MCMLFERDEAVARLLCVKVEEFTADLPLGGKAIEFMSWKEHACTWTESLMTRVVPGQLKRLFAAVRAASSRGTVEARLFPEDMRSRRRPGDSDWWSHRPGVPVKLGWTSSGR